MELRLPPIFFWDSDPSIAIPPLGSGNGGLDWQKVKPLIETKLKDLDVDIQVYEPMEMQEIGKTLPKHILNVFNEVELNRSATVAKFATAQIEGVLEILR